jgi:hypothetical protein
VSLAAYRRTAYEAAGAVAHVGRRSVAVDALLAELGTRHGGFITAENPLSRRMPPGWNARAMRRFDEAIRRLPSAAGHGGWRRWREAHHLVAADPRRLLVLARRFRQRAIVVVARGAPARLTFSLAPADGGRAACPSPRGTW